MKYSYTAFSLRASPADRIIDDHWSVVLKRFWKATTASELRARQVQKYIYNFLMRLDISRSLRFQDIFHGSWGYGRRAEQEIAQENAISSPIPSCGTSQLHR